MDKQIIRKGNRVQFRGDKTMVGIVLDEPEDGMTSVFWEIGVVNTQTVEMPCPVSELILLTPWEALRRNYAKRRR